MKCLAHLDLYRGKLLYKGKPPQAYGIPTYRTEVMYVPQRPSLLPLTPQDFVFTVMSFYSRRHSGSNKNELSKQEIQERTEAPMKVGDAIGIGRELWDRNWTELSGGEAQRIMLAIGSSLGTAEILLFDGTRFCFTYIGSVLTYRVLEPTSALDLDTTLAVEEFVLSDLRKPESKLKAIMWITHSEEQARRVGTRFFTIVDGTCNEDPAALV